MYVECEWVCFGCVVIGVYTGCCEHLINVMDIVSCVGMSMFVYIMCVSGNGEHWM